MLFSDYLKYMDITLISQFEGGTKYLSQELKFDIGEQKHGLLYSMKVTEGGTYSISLDQNDMIS